MENFSQDFWNECFDNIYNAKLALTENGALSYDTCGFTKLADQFGKSANYNGRDINDVFFDQGKIWNEDSLEALRFPFYLRMITRKTKISKDCETEKVQKGQGCRDEAFKRMLWIAENEPDAFYKNLWVLPIIGSWKDLWTLMYYDKVYDINALNHDIIFSLINVGLKSDTHSELIKKYMPRIKSGGKCKTEWVKIANELAKEFANYNRWSYKEYNHIKTSGTAHDFQKIICDGRYKDIDWNLIPGRALSKIVTDKFLTKHDIEDDFINWVNNNSTIKFTGYVYELLQRFNNGASCIEKVMINKQFDELVKKASEDGNVSGNVWCALDTSGSMTWEVKNGVTAYDICVSLGIFLSTLNKGAFHKNVVMFDNKSTTLQLDGNFCEMAKQIKDASTAWGGTNFISIIEKMVEIRENNPDIPLEDYPDTILVVSDMQFNPVNGNEETNYEAMKAMLYFAFQSDFVDKMKFVWWQVTGRTNDVPAEMGAGQIFLSGYDPSIISLLLGDEVKEIEKKRGTPISTEESIALALSQEILAMVNL